MNYILSPRRMSLKCSTRVFQNTRWLAIGRRAKRILSLCRTFGPGR